MNALSSLSIVTWFEFFQWATAIAALLTFAAVAGAVITGRIANRKQAEKILALEGMNIEAQRALEAERLTRLELEESIVPRLIPLISDGGVTNVDPLRQFPGTGLVVEYAPDPEAQRAAQNVSNLAQEAGWKLKKADCPPDLIGFSDGVDGVVVTPYRPDNVDPTPDELRSKRAASALVEFLKSNRWIARLAEGHTGELSPDTVKVQVGFKPTPYFMKPIQRDLRKQRMKPAW